MNKDLTAGKPYSVLWRFCLPLFGSIIFQQLYNIADSFVAGRFIGEDALGAVGNSYEITLIFIAIAFGCNMGCSVTVSRLFGGKQYSELKTTVYTALITTGVITLILMVVGIAFSDFLLGIINTPDNIFADSRLYLRIYSFGLPFVFFYNVSTGIFSALGDSRTPFIFLALSSISNIGMDILFVKYFRMGVSGVALATFICQCISCLLAVFVVFSRFKTIKTDGKVALFSWPALKSMSAIAIPSTLQQSFISVGNIVIQGVINSFGSSVTAGYSAAIKLNNLVVTSFSTIGNGISNYTAQNLGAGKTERIKQGFGAGLLFVTTLAIPFCLIYFFCGRSLVRFFLDVPTSAAIGIGYSFIRIVSPFYIIIPMKFVADGILRGAGHMSQFMISTFVDLIIRVVLSFILSARFGYTGIWMSWPVGWIIATAMSVIFYYIYICKKPLAVNKSE